MKVLSATYQVLDHVQYLEDSKWVEVRRGVECRWKVGSAVECKGETDVPLREEEEVEACGCRSVKRTRVGKGRYA